LTDKEQDESEVVNGTVLKKYAGIPVVNMGKLCGPSFTGLADWHYAGGKTNPERPKWSWPGHPSKRHCRMQGQFLCGNDALQEADFVITHLKDTINPEVTEGRQNRIRSRTSFGKRRFCYIG